MNLPFHLHLAAGIEKSFAGSYLNSVVTTRNLLESAASSRDLSRFLLVSSFVVYSNWELSRHRVLDEAYPVEADPAQRSFPGSATVTNLWRSNWPSGSRYRMWRQTPRP